MRTEVLEVATPARSAKLAGMVTAPAAPILAFSSSWPAMPSLMARCPLSSPLLI